MAIATQYEGLTHATAVWRYVPTQYPAPSNTFPYTFPFPFAPTPTAFPRYEDNTLTAQKPETSSFEWLGAADHEYFIGAQSKFDLAVFFLSVNGTYGAFTWAYWNGTTWKEFIPQLAYDWTIGGGDIFPNLTDWTSVAFSASFPHTLAPPDTLERYWIKVTAASVTTVAHVSRLEIRPFGCYTTPTKVARLLQIKNDFSSTSTPTREQVFDIIRRAESLIDFRTRKSWRPNLAVNEEHDFNVNGFQVLHKPVEKMFSLEIWSGSAWERKTEGRTSDYFYVADMGMVMFSRYFLFPARIMGQVVSGKWWGWGEFNYPVRVNYVWGRDLDTDVQFRDVEDIATKIAAIDVYTNHDYSNMVSSGLDNVGLSNKIDLWQRQVDDKLDTLQAWAVI